MKKLIIVVLMAIIVVVACCGFGKIQWNSFSHGRTTVTMSGANSNETIVYEYIDGELQSISRITYVGSTGNEAN